VLKWPRRNLFSFCPVQTPTSFIYVSLALVDFGLVVALVEEKCRHLSGLNKLKIKVEAYHSYHGALPLPKDNKMMCIATIEKATSIVNHLVTTKRMNEVGLIVIDELRSYRSAL